MELDKICYKLSDISYLAPDQINFLYTTQPYNTSNIFLSECKKLSLLASEDRTTCIITKFKNFLIVAFRGTECINNWFTDITLIPLDLYTYVDGLTPLVHKGFHGEYQCVRQRLSDIIQLYITQNPDMQLVFTGHSLGGAIATLISTYFGNIYTMAQILCITFGSPCVGNDSFVQNFIHNVTVSKRYVNYEDPIPDVSLRDYSHVPGLQYIQQDGIINSNMNSPPHTATSRAMTFVKNIMKKLHNLNTNSDCKRDYNCKKYYDKII